MFLRDFVPYLSTDLHVTGKPLRLGLNARGVAKYSDVGHIDSYLGNGAKYGLRYN